MFARESDDNPVKEFFLICTVFTQFEKTYLAFLNILAKCDFLGKMTLRVHDWHNDRTGIMTISPEFNYFFVAFNPRTILQFCIHYKHL